MRIRSSTNSMSRTGNRRLFGTRSRNGSAGLQENNPLPGGAQRGARFSAPPPSARNSCRMSSHSGADGRPAAASVFEAGNQYTIESAAPALCLPLILIKLQSANAVRAILKHIAHSPRHVLPPGHPSMYQTAKDLCSPGAREFGRAVADLGIAQALASRIDDLGTGPPTRNRYLAADIQHFE